jgi:hypothetical protein
VYRCEDGGEVDSTSVSERELLGRVGSFIVLLTKKPLRTEGREARGGGEK